MQRLHSFSFPANWPEKKSNVSLKVSCLKVGSSSEYAYINDHTSCFILFSTCMIFQAQYITNQIRDDTDVLQKPKHVLITQY